MEQEGHRGRGSWGGGWGGGFTSEAAVRGGEKSYSRKASEGGVCGKDGSQAREVLEQSHGEGGLERMRSERKDLGD